MLRQSFLFLFLIVYSSPALPSDACTISATCSKSSLVSSDVYCNYDGHDELLINAAIEAHQTVDVHGKQFGDRAFCSISAPIIGHRYTNVNFNRAIVRAMGNHPIVLMVMGARIENAELSAAWLENYSSIALGFAGDFYGKDPTTIVDVVVRGHTTSKTGVGIGVVADSLGDNRRVTNTHFRGISVHNFATGILLKDANAGSNLDYVNGLFFQGRVSGSLTGIRLEHANGHEFHIQWQPSSDAVTALEIVDSSYNYVRGMFWDSQSVSGNVISLDVDSFRNHIETALLLAYISDLGTDNKIE